jgi:hypothetical protein
LGGTLHRLGRVYCEGLGALGIEKTLNGHDRLPLAGVLSLFATITIKIKCEDTLVIDGSLEHFRMAQGAEVVIAGAPVSSMRASELDRAFYFDNA